MPLRQSIHHGQVPGSDLCDGAMDSGKTFAWDLTRTLQLILDVLDTSLQLLLNSLVSASRGHSRFSVSKLNPEEIKKLPLPL